jgi:nitrogenase molybdenum-iron protein beta chain
MAAPLSRSRAGCALHGALYAASAIDGVTPLVHATPGCAVQAGLWNGQTGCGGLSASSTSNLSEKHIVFGGTSRLREQIKNTRSIVPGELTVVLTGCPAEMIGDDVAAMAQEARDVGDDVIELATAGFRGSAYHGYEIFLKGVIEKSLQAGPRRAGLVNILGPVPRQDGFWLAEIEELSRLIRGIGLKPNPIFGPQGGVASLRALAQAELSLSVSPWGHAAAHLLDERLGVPRIESGGLPVGADATVNLLEQLVSAAGEVDHAAALAFIASERHRENHALDQVIETLYLQGGSRSFAIAAPSLHAGGIARFLVGTLGWIPAAIVITDDPPAASRSAIEADLPSVHYSEDYDEIYDRLAASSAEIVFGSLLERAAAAERNAPLIECASPSRRPGLTTGFGGVRGALTLLEEIVAASPDR